MGWWLLAIGVILTLAIFSIVVYFHRRVTRSMARHTMLLLIKSTQLARMRLDWEHIPPVPSNDIRTEHPFEIDLDISGRHSLHQLLNTAVTRDGGQRLRAWLLSACPDLATIAGRQALVRELAPLTIFRDKLLMKSMLAAHHQGSQLEGKRLLLWLDDHRSTPRLLPLLLLSLAFSLTTLVLFVLNLTVPIPQYWIIALLLTILYLFVTKDRRGDLFEDAHYLADALSQLSIIFDYLETYRYGKNEHLKALCQPFSSRRPSLALKSIARIASAATLQKNILLWIIVNALVPWDFYIAYRFQHYKAQVAAQLPLWLDTWFELEALNSLANFAYLNPEYTLPQVVERAVTGDQAVFQAKGLGHPLIPMQQKVVNDFAMSAPGEIDIITGSNMSGKSTFLRTLGLNLCLAYAGAPVNADLFHTPLFRLFTCIRISDSVTEGYSYFYAEVKRLKALLDELDSPSPLPLFFLIDEIFKGTNNRERLIGSESYISALAGRNCLGVVSTHDLELVGLANKLPQVKNYHFREDVVDGRMVFDYVLREGPSPTTNALKIMQMEGLPVDI